MRGSNLLALGFVALAVAVAEPSYADVVAPSGGSTTVASSVAAGASTTTSEDSADEGGCSVAFVRNTSAVAAGVIAVALLIGMARLRRFASQKLY